MNQSRFERRPAKPTVHPRRVVGGVRLQARAAAAAGSHLTATEPVVGGAPGAPVASTLPDQSAPAAATGWNWGSARWIRLAETHAPGDQLAEGLEYARAGQTRSLEIAPGVITGRVQGRNIAAYHTSLRLPTFAHEQWEAVINAMNAQARYSASVLAGELPANIEDLFAPQSLKLFPTEAHELSLSCNCSVFTGRVQESMSAPARGPDDVGIAFQQQTPWCKHICCLMYLVAERLGQQPLVILSVRGMAEADLVERLRQHRALAGLQRSSGGPVGPTPVYVPHVPRTSGSPAAIPLAELADEFWLPADPDALATLDMPIGKPEVTHPLLRRLGPSPFAGAKFPLVGLLATCYDVISEAAIKSAAAPAVDAISRLLGPDAAVNSGDGEPLIDDDEH